MYLGPVDVIEGSPSAEACRFRRVIRFLVRTAIMLVANGVGLIVAALVLAGMSINATGFVEALVVFTIALALLTPFIASRFEGGARAHSAVAALLATLASLVITDLISNGFEIKGVGTWFAATFVVWGAALLAAFILPYFGLKKYVDDRR
jgi:uncharacterized membrane protein YvlD (DUF360 family)